MNALKFSKPRLLIDPNAANIVIALSLLKSWDEKKRHNDVFLETSVIDKGIGMSEEIYKAFSALPSPSQFL